jgi:[acyl-carrier-protein] S-malonyltransferase
VRAELVDQITSPVRWVASVRTMMAQGVDTFVEIGPGSVLSGLIKRIAPDSRLINLRGADDVLAFGAERSV